LCINADSETLSTTLPSKIAEGFDINFALFNNYTLLHCAVQSSQNSHLTRDSYVECVLTLLEAGADVNARTDTGCTALHVAATVGSAPIVQALMERGAEVNATEDNSFTPLTLAAMNKHQECVDMLMNGGEPTGDEEVDESNEDDHHKKNNRARVDVCDCWDRTPLMLAAIAASKAAETSNNGLEEDQKAWIAICRRLIRNKDTPLGAKEKNKNRTALHYLVKAGLNSVLKEFIDKITENCMSSTSMMNITTSSKLEKDNVLNAVDYKEKTALVWAIQRGDEEQVRILLTEGARVDIGTPSPLHVAVKLGFFEIARLLLREFCANANLLCGTKAIDYREASPLLVAMMTSPEDDDNDEGGADCGGRVTSGTVGTASGNNNKRRIAHRDNSKMIA